MAQRQWMSSDSLYRSRFSGTSPRPNGSNPKSLHSFLPDYTLCACEDEPQRKEPKQKKKQQQQRSVLLTRVQSHRGMRVWAVRATIGLPCSHDSHCYIPTSFHPTLHYYYYYYYYFLHTIWMVVLRPRLLQLPLGYMPLLLPLCYTRITSAGSSCAFPVLEGAGASQRASQRVGFRV
jgi:hypothetical protein